MALTVSQESLLYSVYLAPRGKKRLLILGHQIAQRYLSPMDKLIGIVGDAGAGKSLFIKGMFPGLELTNDDDGVNIRPLPLLEGQETGFFNSHTFHLDIRFESAFTQMHVLADAVTQAIKRGKRVIVEHFDLLYPFLNSNADLMVGIGEEVIVTRPNIFGPMPEEIKKIVFKSVKYRKMAHSAEDITCRILADDYGIPNTENHNDVLHGFVLEFKEKPNINIEELEQKVLNIIEQNLDISYCDDNHITVGSTKYDCTGPRIHIKNTGNIKNFQLMKEYKYDPITELYTLVGTVGKKENRMEKLNKLQENLD